MESHQFQIGAEPCSGGVWFQSGAPDQDSVAVQIEGQAAIPLRRQEDGYFFERISGLKTDSCYRLRLNDGALIPDPASRFQPEGPHGPSQVIDPHRFHWTDQKWTGRTLEEYVIYEMHIGSFTNAGTWQSATREIGELAAVGITCIEVMPVAEFPGRWGWGYDGVGLFAPFHHYGSPDEFRAFVDTAHKYGICVILDVVYNHMGPDGNHLRKLASAYFSQKHDTDWGDAINFDGPDCEPVRNFFLANAVYWIRDFHLDGLRLDATQDIHDASSPENHILTEIGRQVRAAAPERTIVVISENEPQQSDLCRDVERGGYGLDALWNDDFHHSAMVALTGHSEAYYTDYRGDPQEFVSAAKYGYLYQGQWYSWQKKRRGRPGFDLPQSRFITFLQNHDQVANSGRGLRVHQLSSPGKYRALTALMLLGPGTPMLFQGQEFAASTPFLYFADHNSELTTMVDAGRREFLSQFRSLTDAEAQALLAHCADATTFTRCKLNLTERETNKPAYQLTRDLLTLRRVDDSFRPDKRRSVDGAVLGPQAFILRYFMQDGFDRLLVVNLGHDLHLNTIPEPLLGSVAELNWTIALSTDQVSYGGGGVGPVVTEDVGWRIPGESAVFMVLASTPAPSVPSEGVSS